MLRFTLFALLAVLTVASANKTVTVGYREHGDSVQLQQKVDFESKWIRSRTETETFTIDGNYKITLLEIIDVKQKDKSADAAIISGGVGKSYVTIKFISAAYHGIHYLVKIYGKLSPY